MGLGEIRKAGIGPARGTRGVSPPASNLYIGRIGSEQDRKVALSGLCGDRGAVRSVSGLAEYCIENGAETEDG